MIKTAKEAYGIAKKIKEYKKYDTCFCREDDISYFFTYPVPGVPLLRIYKENGNYEKIPFHMAINMKIENEKIIPLSQLK